MDDVVDVTQKYITSGLRLQEHINEYSWEIMYVYAGPKIYERRLNVKEIYVFSIWYYKYKYKYFIIPCNDKCEKIETFDSL